MLKLKKLPLTFERAKSLVDDCKGSLKDPVFLDMVFKRGAAYLPQDNPHVLALLTLVEFIDRGEDDFYYLRCDDLSTKVRNTVIATANRQIKELPR